MQGGPIGRLFHFRMLKRALLLIAFATSLHAAPPKPYHIVLEANPAAAFPFLSRFGAVTLDVYPAGVRAGSLWLNGFARKGNSAVTVENPVARMYADIPLEQIRTTLRKLSTSGVEDIAPVRITQIAGAVKGIPARRYRMLYGAEAWIDVWTTDTIPENPQFRAIVDEFVRGISPATATAMSSIRGMPLSVELNFHHYKNVPLVRLKSIVWKSDGQNDALKTNAHYVKAPRLDSIWK
jgi:hypothetical protein